MYGLVPYNLSDKQKCIQFGHAVVEYGLSHYADEYIDWAKNHKTFIVLDGGTTNNNLERLGTLNTYANQLETAGVNIGRFYEPHLNDALTGVVAILDERCFNFEKYPDLPLEFDTRRILRDGIAECIKGAILGEKECKKIETSLIIGYGSDIGFAEWVSNLGGPENLFLREFFRRFKLA